MVRPFSLLETIPVSPIKYQLKLFVAGDTDLSRRAIANLHRICAERLAEQCEVEVIDILETPEEAVTHRVLATPVTIRVDLDHPRKALGDLSSEERLLHALNLKPRNA
jgi:circadian clock protein KaiB